MSTSQQSKTVLRCYDLFDAAIAGGVKDFTDGMYYGDSSLAYITAQKNQAEWLLNQIDCKKGSRIIDVGCGNGRILSAAESRGAEAVGITISRHQVKRNKNFGLNAHLMSYLDIPEKWNKSFDGIISNGTIEHFVQVEDAQNMRQGKIYIEMFKIFHRILKSGGKLATTTIHFNQEVDPHKIAKGSKSHEKGSKEFHFAKVLLEDFGCWYPHEGDLEKYSQELFQLITTEDGTQDYNWTSEYWLKRMRQQISRNPRVWGAIITKLITHPIATVSMLNNLLISQSWMWQFRKINDHTPTKLSRQIWKRID